MIDDTDVNSNVSRQGELRERCRHPQGGHVEFTEVDIASSISKRFEQQVALFPQRPAYCDEEHSLTYDELNRAANRVAHALVEERSDDGAPVACLLDERIQDIIAFLGILKAGKCFVGVNSALPESRQEVILRQSGSTLVLAGHDKLKSTTAVASHPCRILALDEIGSCVADNNLSFSPRPDQPCWIVYTSGSTGHPKGVVQTHQNILHDIGTYINNYHLSRFDRLSLVMSLSTNAGCFGGLMALLAGAAVCRIDVAGRGVPHMADLIERLQLSIWGGVPSLFRQWMANDLPDYPGLRIVWFGGEAVHARDLELYRQKLSSSCLFINRLGSTETGCTRIFFADKATQISTPTVPVGYPVQGRDVLLVRPDGSELFGPGVGELVVRSRFLSPGYWQEPELTAQVFTAEGDGSSERLYRTGDLATRSVDGCLTYQGRKDFQVQIRGYRVEVAEIEAVLDRMDFVREAAVYAQNLDGGGHRLVACVVGDSPQGLPVSELRRRLSEKLPSYMVPARFVFVDALPRAANGKVVRSRLPTPDESRPDLSTPFVAPRGDVQRRLAAIWQHVLGIKSVGIHDHFLELGGDSLLASRVSVYVNDSFGVEISMRQVFNYATVGELAAVIEGQRRAAYGDDLLERRAVNGTTRQRRCASFAQERLWLLDCIEEGRLSAYNVCYAWQLCGSLDRESLQLAIQKIVERHEPLRTTYELGDDGLEQIINSQLEFELTTIDLGSVDENLRAKQFTEHQQKEADRPFNLAKDLMVRGALVRLSDEEHLFTLTFHHIAVDGWSIGNFMTELGAIYTGLVSKRPAQLPSLKVTYADYAEWQRRKMRDERLGERLTYWRQKLVDFQPLSLPIDRPRSQGLSYFGDVVRFEVDSALVMALRRLARAQQVTLNMVLLAAFQILIYRYTGQQDLAMATPSHGRDVEPLEPLVGFFANTILLMSRVEPQQSFCEFLVSIREHYLDAFDYGDLPYQKLVEAMDPERHRGQDSLVRAMFQLFELPRGALSLSGLEVNKLAAPCRHARFDLELLMMPDGQSLAGELTFRTDLFERQTVACMSERYCRLLRDVSSHPDRSLDQLNWLSKAEGASLHQDFGHAENLDAE